MVLQGPADPADPVARKDLLRRAVVAAALPALPVHRAGKEVLVDPIQVNSLQAHLRVAVKVFRLPVQDLLRGLARCHLRLLLRVTDLKDSAST